MNYNEERMETLAGQMRFDSESPSCGSEIMIDEDRYADDRVVRNLEAEEGSAAYPTDGGIMPWQHKSGDVWEHINKQKDESVVHTIYNNNNYSKPRTPKEDALIANALGKAIRHAERVVRREHIKADRVERVNHFITSMRRELSFLEGNKDIFNDLRLYVGTILCDKNHWNDIGVTTSIGHSLINTWLSLMQTQRHSADAQSEEILADLEELERNMAGMKQTVAEAEMVNKESDEIVEKLCDVFQLV